MKTSIDISDALFSAVKSLALQRKTTLGALVEEGLRRVLADAAAKTRPAFKLKDARVRGKAALLPDPRSWRQLEEDHVVSRVAMPRQ